ncbi:MAG: 23S rRNA (adenine(2503)-C(2))-methyltransferase RlmN [Rikenellaceae bacterium]
MANKKISLLGLTLAQLAEVCTTEGLPKFTAKQIANWLYVRRVESIDEMTNISLANRQKLNERYCAATQQPIKRSVSSDGTEKFLFETHEGAFIEAVYIPDAERATLCVSSQAGCRMGCQFCATGQQGLQHSLSASQIINQIMAIPESQKLTNLVFMGMGEPLDNYDNVKQAIEVITSAWGLAWSPRRITLSTAGVTPVLRRLIEECEVDIAISLHNPYHDERAEIMPIERAYPIAELVEMLREYDFSGQRRLSFEYILMSGKNGSPHHIREIARLLNGLNCRINIIRFHKIPGSPFYSPDDEKVTRFRNNLTAKGIHTTIRRSRGEDIEAACGLLSTKSQIEQQ